MSLRVEPFDGAAEEWDALVRRTPGWTPFHLYCWRDIYQRVGGHEAPYLAARRDDGSLSGVLPLVRVRSLLFGHFLISVPYLNYGGPLGDADSVRALAARAADLAREGGVKLLELRNRQEQPIELPVSHRKITVLLDLVPGNPDATWKKLDSKLRSQVRRPQKEGVEVRFGADQVEPFFTVFAHHMRDLGTPTQPRALFEAVAAGVPGAWFGCAYVNGDPVACGAGFRWHDEFEMTWASSLRAYSRIAPNMLLYWAFIERAAADGAAVFNFGRCTPGSGTHKFKRQWGARDEQLWWYQVAQGTNATPSPDDGAYSWGPRLWRRLPLPLATALGPRIVRFIP